MLRVEQRVEERSSLSTCPRTCLCHHRSPCLRESCQANTLFSSNSCAQIKNKCPGLSFCDRGHESEQRSQRPLLPTCLPRVMLNEIRRRVRLPAVRGGRSRPFVRKTESCFSARLQGLRVLVVVVCAMQVEVLRCSSLLGPCERLTKRRPDLVR